MMKKKQDTRNKIQTKSGFTLIEMIVAVAVFAVVMTLALGSFLNVSDIQRKAMALRAVNGSLNFAVELMMREIRTGGNYGIGGNSFSFTNASNCSVDYTLSGSQIKREESGGGICTNYGPLAVTSTEVEIDNLLFIVRGEGVNDGQPIVTIIINGTAGEKEKVKSRLNLQATVSQREIDSS